MSTDILQTMPEMLARLEALRARGGRRILGIVGPPGSGKSMIAEMLCEALGPHAVVLPMDGFHLAQAELERIGRAVRKGAPDTFDVTGFVAILKRLRTARADETVYAPHFHREIENAIAGSIAIPPEVDTIVTEGNYLLADGAWRPVRDHLDESWYLDVPMERVEAQLLARMAGHGRPPAEARAWADTVDLPNARFVMRTQANAAAIVRYH